MNRTDITMRYMLCAFNLFIMFLGLVTVFIGVVYQLDWKVVKNALKPYLIVAPWVFIIMGTLMFVIATLGFCGPLFNNKIMVIAYVISLLVIIILQAVIAILLIASKDTVKKRIMKFGNHIFQGAPKSSTLRSITNSVQEQFECCGWSGVEDYGLDAIYSLPGSCCRETEFVGYIFHPKCSLRFASPGCKRKIADFYDKNSSKFVTIAIAVACLLVICIAVALYIIKFKRKRKTSWLPFAC